jgi:hypothetical protein
MADDEPCSCCFAITGVGIWIMALAGIVYVLGDKSNSHLALITGVSVFLFGVACYIIWGLGVIIVGVCTRPAEQKQSQSQSQLPEEITLT